MDAPFPLHHPALVVGLLIALRTVLLVEHPSRRCATARRAGGRSGPFPKP
jgi:hypothetical protein